MTLVPNPKSQEAGNRLVYIQFYSAVKTLFDSAKVYIFNNDALENLALDPAYVRLLQQEGGAVAFSEQACWLSYLHSKQQVHVNLTNNCQHFYSLCKEFCIALSLIEDIETE